MGNERKPTETASGLPMVRDHRRDFAANRYVYPVVSRRSKGLSIGINLNPDKICNFDCVYCQVDRRTPPVVREVEVPRLLAELSEMLDLVESGEIYEIDRFHETPPRLRHFNDIAFSGDGEPTTCPEFLPVVRAIADLKQRRGLDPIKLVLITNATRLHHPPVAEALTVLDANNGKVWAKLEAGTDGYYREIERTTIPMSRVLENITTAAKVRPLVIQAMFLQLHGEPPSRAELEAFCDRLNEIKAAGGKIKHVQVYTVAREPAERWVTPLSNKEVDAIAEMVRKRTGFSAEGFYSA